jgi:Tol biopolymer transport system component
VGSRPSLPAPFGLADNGLVAFARDGDIYVADPRSGNERVVVAGAETDLRPVWSLDGTRFAFERKATVETGPGRVFVANADGTELTEVTGEPLVGIEAYAFSPDGREILIAAGPESEARVHVATSDGTDFRTMQTAMIAIEPAWRPDGTEILFTGIGITLHEGLYAFDADTSVVRPILEPRTGWHRGNARWSPDGTRIAYVEWVDSDVMTARTHVISADGTGDRLLALPPYAFWEAFNSWSNDGTRLINVRGYTGLFEDVRAVVAPADGSNTGVEIDFEGSIQRECCSVWEWAPDDSSILGTPTDSTGTALLQVILDPASGTSRTAPWSTDSYPAWQRVAR